MIALFANETSATERLGKAEKVFVLTLVARDAHFGGVEVLRVEAW